MTRGGVVTAIALFPALVVALIAIVGPHADPPAAGKRLGSLVACVLPAFSVEASAMAPGDADDCDSTSVPDDRRHGGPWMTRC